MHPFPLLRQCVVKIEADLERHVGYHGAIWGILGISNVMLLSPLANSIT